MKDGLDTKKFPWKIFTFIAVSIWLSLPLFSFLAVHAEDSRLPTAVCPTGKLSVRLTGWTLNGKMPTGFAEFSTKDKQLKVSVDSVVLDDGTKLDVLIGDDKIGEIEGLKNGTAKASLNPTEVIKEGSRVRVFNDERPIVSANLACDNSAPSPSVSPSMAPTVSPTTSPSAAPSLSPSPSPSVAPSLVPPMSPSPSPTLQN